MNNGEPAFMPGISPLILEKLWERWTSLVIYSFSKLPCSSFVFESIFELQ